MASQMIQLSYMAYILRHNFFVEYQLSTKQYWCELFTYSVTNMNKRAMTTTTTMRIWPLTSASYLSNKSLIKLSITLQTSQTQFASSAVVLINYYLFAIYRLIICPSIDLSQVSYIVLCEEFNDPTLDNSACTKTMFANHRHAFAS